MRLTRTQQALDATFGSTLAAAPPVQPATSQQRAGRQTYMSASASGSQRDVGSEQRAAGKSRRTIAKAPGVRPAARGCTSPSLRAVSSQCPAPGGRSASGGGTGGPSRAERCIKLPENTRCSWIDDVAEGSSEARRGCITAERTGVNLAVDALMTWPRSSAAAEALAGPRASLAPPPNG